MAIFSGSTFPAARRPRAAARGAALALGIVAAVATAAGAEENAKGMSVSETLMAYVRLSAVCHVYYSNLGDEKTSEMLRRFGYQVIDVNIRTRVNNRITPGLFADLSGKAAFALSGSPEFEAAMAKRCPEFKRSVDRFGRPTAGSD